MSYILHYAPATASMAVHWMLLELDVPFEAVEVDFDAGAQRSPDFLTLNPMGRVPVLIVDGAAYSESTALCMLLAERHPQAGFAPKGGPARARWLQTMAWLANGLQASFRDWFYAAKDGAPEDAEAIKRLARKRIEATWDRLDGDLADGRLFLLGDAVTTADFIATMHMRWSRNMPRTATDWPHIDAYVRRMRDRPAYVELSAREGLSEWQNA